ncbi:MAG: winged helix-turn-helix domain-containing protein [Acidobacteriia bacterium]|nr:winged helix-turn-helix domain-containing protein [Terriglobia bacterium]
MPTPVSTPRRLSFGPYEADLRSGELRKRGTKVRLQSQPFQLLAMLLERPGELVTREEICQKLWPEGTFVDFDHSLGTAINKIREVLNDSAAEPRFLETVPRRGYRFIATVTAVAEPSQDVSPLPSLETEAEEKNHRKLSSRWFIWAGAGVVLLVAALVAWYSLRPHPIQSIAVLPLENLSTDPNQQFFADGVTDELTTNLAQIGSLRVISHTSAVACSGPRKSALQIARCLGVDALVEGSVVRSGDRVRITVQLIQAASDRHLWAHTYDLQLSDVLTVQGELARAIAASISHTLTPQEDARLSRPRPVDPEVALLYFKGSYFLSKPDPWHARDVFLQATQLDPNSAESWAGLADALHTMGVFGDPNAFDQAKVAANRALEIDPSQAQALMALGATAFLNDWNPGESEAYFRRSIAARPSYAMAHALFATTLAHRGRFEEAIQQIKLAGILDPVSVTINSLAWHVYFCARRYDDALRIILATNELDPTFLPAYRRLAISWEQKGEYQKAIDTGVRGRIAAGEAPEKAKQEASQLRAALASGGPRGYWQTLLDRIPPDERWGLGAAYCYMHLGRHEEALEALEKSYQRRDDPYLIMWIPSREEFDPLRSDPRFQKMLHDLGIS